MNWGLCEKGCLWKGVSVEGGLCEGISVKESL